MIKIERVSNGFVLTYPSEEEEYIQIRRVYQFEDDRDEAACRSLL